MSALKSEEASESKKSLSIAADAAESFSKSISKAWTAAGDAFNSELGDQSLINSTDEYLQKVFSGIKRMFTSPEVKKSLSEASDSSRRSSQELTSAANLITKKLSKQLDESDVWNKALSDLGNSISVLVTAMTVSVSNLLSEKRDRQLPSDSRK